MSGNPSSNEWGHKPYRQSTMLEVDGRESEPVNLATNAGYIHAAHRPYVDVRPYGARVRAGEDSNSTPGSPYAFGQPISNAATQRAKPRVAKKAYVMPFESWFNNAKALFGSIKKG